MMRVRCQRCGWMLTLGREAIALALAEVQHSHEQYHTLNCPRCRHAIKIQSGELRRRLPPDYPLPEISPTVKPEKKPKAESAPVSAAEAKPEAESAPVPAAEAKPEAESSTPPAPVQATSTSVMSGTE